MSPDLDDGLVRDFPRLYRDRHGDTRETRMCDGFPGSGWEPLIRRMSEQIEEFCVGTDLRAVQVKSKFNVLRVYLTSSTPIPDEVNAAVHRAVGESVTTCEGCGATTDEHVRNEAPTAGHPRRLGPSGLCDWCAVFAEEWQQRRFRDAPGDEEWREQFRGKFGRIIPFDEALRRWLSRAENIRPSVPNPMALDIFGRPLEPLADDDPRQTLLARRVPREAIVLGRAYVIHARNGGVGVAVERDGVLGYQLHREKWGEHYLFVEYDWADDPNFGTAIPLALIEAEPPNGKDELLAWLTKQATEHRAEIDGAWEVILGVPRSQLAELYRRGKG